MDSAHALWVNGWVLVIAGFASGALIGLGFERESFLGGYGSWRRRLVRLGHIACVMLGVLQMLVALSPAGAASGALATWCWRLWIVGAIAMPLVCFASAWKPALRHLFAVPVVCLITAAGFTLALIVKGSAA